jgi:hypothetical protein
VTSKRLAPRVRVKCGGAKGATSHRFETFVLSGPLDARAPKARFRTHYFRFN